MTANGETEDTITIGKAVVRLEFEGTTVDADILDLQMAIEEIQINCARDSKSMDVLKEVAAMFKEKYELQLTPSQTWQVLQACQAAYDKLKKKLNATLESAFGTVPILLRDRPSLLTGSTGSSPSSERKENLTTDLPTANSPGTG